MIYKELDDFRKGDIIRIVLLDDTFLNIDYKNAVGTITAVDYKTGTLQGTWGKIGLYPERDDIELVKPINDNPR